MTEVNYIAEALKFMVLGMGVVFLFLVVLVQLIKLQASLIQKYFPDKAPITPIAPKIGSEDRDEEQKRVAAIIAAISEYSKNK